MNTSYVQKLKNKLDVLKNRFDSENDLKSLKHDAVCLKEKIKTCYEELENAYQQALLLDTNISYFISDIEREEEEFEEKEEELENELIKLKNLKKAIKKELYFDGTCPWSEQITGGEALDMIGEIAKLIHESEE
jgi:predicted  nucleic acid-binding Zn-ribbon protein